MSKEFTIYRTKDLRVFLIILTLSFEILIMQMQKYINPKFFIPRKFKRLPYNYYVTLEFLKENNKADIVCPICLEPLKINEEKKDIQKKNDIQYSDLSLISSNNHSFENNIYPISILEIDEKDKNIKQIDSLNISINKNCPKKRKLIEKMKNISFFFSTIHSKFKAFITDIYQILKYSNRKTPYMNSPCSHLFHSECLEIWLDKKNECPYCRMSLPFIE